MTGKGMKMAMETLISTRGRTRRAFASAVSQEYDVPSSAGFRLRDSFVASYAEARPPFGFNGLGEMVYVRTYARKRSDGTREKWIDTVERVQ
jgi:hypothetical protein